MLEVRGLDAGYGSVEVLWDVDLEVGENEIVALVGSNGAGKTTLLRAISGLIRPTGGEVGFDGRPLAGLAPERIVSHGIAHVPEGRHLFQGLTVRENLMAGAYARRNGTDVDEVVELFPRLGERMSQLAGSMSGGEQQMCAIARALMSGPKLVLLDEPSMGLAPVVVAQVFELVRRIRAEGYTVLIVEQNVAQVLKIVDRAYLLEVGRIKASGPAAALLASDEVRRAYMGL
ncbi:MAG: ABC transporter ATP-binding protein [Microvirga sp.]